MSKLRFSASSLDRIAACPASAVLPQQTSTSESASRGTAIHAFLERCKLDGYDAAIADVPDDLRSLCEAIDVDALPAGCTPEVAFAYNVLTGKARILGRGLARNYGQLDTFEIPGTADLYGVGDGCAYVADYKTGRNPIAAHRSLQLRFYALCAARAAGLDFAIAEIIRIDESGNVWRDRACFDVLTLDEFAHELAQTFGKARDALSAYAAGDAIETTTGDHCDYCPGYLSCPAKTALLRGIGDGSALAPVIAAAGKPLTQEQALDALRAIAAIRKVVSAADRQLHDYARTQGPIDLGDGTVWGPVLTEGNERIDGAAAHRVVAQHFGAEIADAAVTRSATKASIERALKKTPGALAPKMRTVLTELRNAGATTRPMTERFTTYPKDPSNGNEAKKTA